MSSKKQSIVLRSTSGKWKYKTTTTDPLFAPILGAMLEAGLELPKELVLEGATGEILERDWHYVDKLREWMDWEAIVDALLPHSYSQLLGMKPYGFMPNPSPVLPAPPGDVLWRHELSQLSSILSLPTGWEAHVAVDQRSPRNERLYHMRGSLDFIRDNPVSGMRIVLYTDNVVDALALQASDPTMTQAVVQYDRFRQPVAPTMGHDVRVSLMDPFIRNIYLMQLAGVVAAGPFLGRRPSPWDKITIPMPVLLGYTDWNAAATILGEHGKVLVRGKEEINERIIPPLRLVDTMLGDMEGDRLAYGVNLAKSMQGIGFVHNYRAQDPLDSSLLARVYTYMLSVAPEDIPTNLMGLEPILGIKKVSTWAAPPSGLATGSHTSSVSDIIGWVNATVITYPRWYTDMIQSKTAANTEAHRSTNTLLIPRDAFPQIVQFLGETLGLYVMRRILLSLLYYTSETVLEEPKKARGKVSAKAQAKYEEDKRMVERAELFAGLLEEYLAAHEGEDEEIVTLRFNETKTVKQLQKYYW